jgi:hypothetical protein
MRRLDVKTCVGSFRSSTQTDTSNIRKKSERMMRCFVMVVMMTNVHTAKRLELLRRQTACSVSLSSPGSGQIALSPRATVTAVAAAAASKGGSV